MKNKINQKKCTELHDKAMLFDDKAFAAEKEGQIDKAKEYHKKAFEFEKKAAMILISNLEIEPTRSVLFRSAAWLAYNAGEYREAELMAAYGLSGNPPKMIMDELREVMEEILAKIKEESLASTA